LAATSKADRGLADQLAENVVNKLVEQGFTSTRTPTVEDIQDIVESTLIDSGNSDIAKAYIVYRHYQVHNLAIMNFIVVSTFLH